MAAIDQLIQVSVTSTTVAVTQATFATPLILGPTKASGATPTVITCSSPADLLTQGYTTASIEYIYATALASQDLTPSVFKVGTRTASGSIDADIAAVQTIDDTWYGLVCPQISDADIMTAATTLEGLGTKFGFFATACADALDPNKTTDIASLLQAKDFSRSLLIVSPGSWNLGIEAAWIALLAAQPGSTNFAIKQLKGIAADSFSPTQAQAVIGVPVLGLSGKNGNIYQKVGGINATEMGITPSGMFADMRVGIDSLKSTIKTNIYSMMASVPKIPQTEVGATLIENCIRAAIKTHQGYNFLAADYTITHTPLAQMSQAALAQRQGPPFTFTCQAQGAVNSVTISGNVNI